MKKAVTLFLDSGAFSSWSKGSEIDIDEYIEFVKEHQKFLEVYANLDVIGDAESTYKNQKYMEKKGLNPMPVYHTGKEDPKWLERYVKEGYQYIGLGGMAGKDMSKAVLVVLLDSLWTKYLLHKDGMPKVKVHGFGMTSVDLMFRYPWYSVDSTTWVMASRFGSVLVPKFKNGRPNYSETPWTVSVSNRSPEMKEYGGRHFQTFSPLEQQMMLEYFQSKGYGIGKSNYKKVKSLDYELKKGERWFGKEEADAQRSIHGDRSGYVKLGWGKDLIVETVVENGLSNDYTQRDVMNIIYFLDLEKNSAKWPWPFKASQRVTAGFGLR